MDDDITEPTSADGSANVIPPRSLKELIDRVSGRNIRITDIQGESGLFDRTPFPFLALVGQQEMKLALLLTLINPDVGGVLLVGPRGIGKTTAVRSLADLLPHVPRSLCYYGCMPEDIEIGGIDMVCPECAQKYARNEPLAAAGKVRLIELPLNSKLDDVIGYVDARDGAMEHFRIRKGILSLADRNLLYIDEVNLLADEIVDAILDASAQGHFNVRRGPMTATYHSRFVLIGSMNPEEGQLRPQIMDRFGLRLLIDGLEKPNERLEAYKRVRAYQINPYQMALQYAYETDIAREEIQSARELLPDVSIPDPVAQRGLDIVKKMKVASLRAEITMFEAARAYSAADGRKEVSEDDLRNVAPMALRLRRSRFIEEYFSNQDTEESEIQEVINTILD